MEETFTLPMSSQYYHENRQHPISRATNLIKLFGRPAPSSPSPNHSCNQNAPSFLVDLNRKVSMSHNSGKASGSSRPCSRKDMSHETPIASTIAGPKPRKTPKEGQPPLLRRMASLSQDSLRREMFELELKPRTSMEDIRNFDRPPQNRTHTGFVWPFQKGSASQLPSRKLSSNVLPEGPPKFRVVGRGGSGSQLRRVSISSSAVGPDVPRPRQPPKADFYRPTGRGGMGSSTRPLTPSKPPISVLGLLSGRGRIQKAQRNGQCGSQEVPPHTRTQSLSSNLNYRPPNEDLVIISSYSEVSLDDGSFTLSPSAASSTSEGLCSISRNSDPGDYGSTNSYFEEPIRPIPIEHHQRSVNKLSKTLGVFPAPVMEGPLFNKPPRKYSEALLTNLGDKFIKSESSRRSSMFVDDLHRFDFAGDLSKPWGDLDDDSSVEDDTPHSPITFAPASPLKSTSHPLPPSDVDSNSTTPSPAGESNSTYSYTSTELSLDSLPTPPTTHLRVPNHSRSHSAFLYEDLPQAPNGLPIKANWLVPVGMHNDDVVISIRRDAPATHPPSWMGEWNNDMQDVIDGLRRL